MGLVYYDQSGVQHTLEDWRVIHKTIADFGKNITPKPIFLTQYDTSIPIVAVDLYNNDEVYAVPVTTAIRVRLKKKDGYIVYNPVIGFNEARTTVYFEFTYQMGIFDGELYAILEMSTSSPSSQDESTPKAGSSYLLLVIRKNPIQNGDTQGSEQEIQDLNDLIDEAHAAIAEMQGTVNRVTTLENKFTNGMSYSASTETLTVPFVINVES